MARTDTLELYVHECRQVLWTVSSRERVARRRAACHLSATLGRRLSSVGDLVILVGDGGDFSWGEMGYVLPSVDMRGAGAASMVLEPSMDRAADCTGHVVPGARPCALGTFSYLVSSTSYFRLSYPNRLL